MATYKIVSAQALKKTGASGKPYDVVEVKYLNESGEEKTNFCMKFKDAALYEAAKGLSAGAVIDVVLEQDGKYMNWKSFTASTSKGPTKVGAAGDRFDMSESERNASIQRQVALKCAVDLVVGGTLDYAPHEVAQLASQFLIFLQGGDTALAVDPQDDLADDGIPR